MFKKITAVSAIALALAFAPPMSVESDSVEFAIGASECMGQVSPCEENPDYSCIYYPPTAPLEGVTEYHHACSTQDYGCETYAVGG